MKITKPQLRKIIKEALPPHLQKHFRKDGSSVYEPQIKDVTPAGYGPDDGASQISASDIDMEDLALIYDDEFGPDYVFGILASEFPALDSDAVADKALRMLKDAARRGEEDYPLSFLAKRLAELGTMKENKMKITESQIRRVVKRILKENIDVEMGGGNEKEAAFRKIVDEKQAGKVDGSMVDLFSASAVVAVLDALNEKNKEHFLSLPPVNMAKIAFKMMKK